MRKIKASIFGVSIGIIMFYMVTSGCTWITFTANDRLTDKIALKPQDKVNLIYLEFSEPAEDLSVTAEDFVGNLKDKLIEKRYKLVNAPGDADLTAKFKIYCYTKKEGIMYFFLGIIPIDAGAVSDYALMHRIDGVRVFATYITTKGKCRKTYTAYFKGNLYSYTGTPIQRITSAIIADLNRLATKQ